VILFGKSRHPYIAITIFNRLNVRSWFKESLYKTILTTVYW